MYVFIAELVGDNPSKPYQLITFYSNVLSDFTNAILFLLSYCLSNMLAVFFYLIVLSFRLCYICVFYIVFLFKNFYSSLTGKTKFLSKIAKIVSIFVKLRNIFVDLVLHFFLIKYPILALF